MWQGGQGSRTSGRLTNLGCAEPFRAGKIPWSGANKYRADTHRVGPMDITEVRQFLRENHRAVMATTRSDGGPQLSPVAVALDDQDRLVVSSRETAMKVKNLRRRPRAWLCLLNDSFFGSWAQIEGPVEVVSLPEAMEGLVDYYRRVAGEHPDWEDYRAAMAREQRVLLRVGMERVGPTRSG